jgi:hypothetical protein
MNIRGRDIVTVVKQASLKSAPAAGLTLALTFCLCGITGCALGGVQLSGPQQGSSSSGAVVTGHVHGGQQPVTGAVLQIYAAGAPPIPVSGGSTGGYGRGAVALVPAGSMTAGSTNNYFPGGASGCAYAGANTNHCTVLPQTDSNGNFTVTGDYTCPASASQVYLVATGGNPGVGGTTVNPYIALMVGLGTCPASGTLSPTLSLDVDEVTTVATVWALQQFFGAPTGIAASSYASQGGTTAGAGVNIGAPSGPAGGYGGSGVQTAVYGMQNAFLMIDNLTNIGTGSSGTGPAGTATNSWATPWADKINTIADILASCINSDPNTSSGNGGTTSSNCSTLMSDATPSGAPNTAADTIQAALYMAQNPTNNVAALYNLIPPTAPYLALTSAPTDWAVFVGLSPQFSAGGNAVSTPYSGAFDEYGHLWLTNFSTTALATPFVSELAGDGSVLAGPFGNFANAAGMGNAFTAASTYTASTAGDNVACSTTATHNLTFTSASGGPKGIAVDLSNVVWVTNQDETACGASGALKSTYTLMRIQGGSGYTGSGAALTSGYFIPGSAYGGIGVDGSNDTFVATSGTAANSRTDEYPNGSGFTGGISTDAASPSSVVIDTNAHGSGPNVWTVGQKSCVSPLGQVYQQPIANIAAATGTFTYQDATCTSSNGTTGTVVNLNAALSTPLTAAVDANNNIWLTNSAGTSTNINFLAPGATGLLDTTAATSLTSAAGVGGIATATAVAVDGQNQAWVSTSGATGTALEYYFPALSATLGNPITIGLAAPFNGTGNSGLGFAAPLAASPFPKTPKSMAIDPSGNVWYFNSSGNTATPYNWVSVLVGQAAPVITPLALQVKANMIGQKP